MDKTYFHTLTDELEPSRSETMPPPQCPFASLYQSQVQTEFTSLEDADDTPPKPRIYTPQDVFALERMNGNFDSQTAAPYLAQDLELMKGILIWMQNFIMRPHPKFGREGAICPFVKPSIENQATFMTVARFPGETLTVESVLQSILSYKDIFIDIGPQEGDAKNLKALVILLPDIQLENIAEETLTDFMEPLHKKLKTELLNDKLLIGQFYPGCKIPGTWSPDFFPLRSPTPLLVIRNLIETDWRFLHGNPEWESAYKERFQDQLLPEPLPL